MGKWLLAILICGLVLAGLAYFKYAEIQTGIEQAQSFPEQMETVETATVLSVPYKPKLNVIGEVLAPQRLDLRNEMAGEISSVNFESGQPIVQGQVLIELDTSEERADLEAAQARAELARVVLARAEDLLTNDLSSAEQVDRARADVATAEASVKVLERRIQKMTLRAPFAGRAGLHNFEVGQFLPANTLITSLVGDTDYAWVDFQVPQFYAQLSVGDRVEIAPIETSRAGDMSSASVVAENTILNERNRSRSYRAQFSASIFDIGANSMVSVRVPTGNEEQLLRVPGVAVQNDPLGQFVYRIQNEGASDVMRAFRQRVVVRVVSGDYALLEVGTGLNAGERIAAAGAFKLYEGIRVLAGERPTAVSDLNTDATAEFVEAAR